MPEVINKHAVDQIDIGVITTQQFHSQAAEGGGQSTSGGSPVGRGSAVGHQRQKEQTRTIGVIQKAWALAPDFLGKALETMSLFRTDSLDVEEWHGDCVIHTCFPSEFFIVAATCFHCLALDQFFAVGSVCLTPFLLITVLLTSTAAQSLFSFFWRPWASPDSPEFWLCSNRMSPQIGYPYG